MIFYGNMQIKPAVLGSRVTGLTLFILRSISDAESYFADSLTTLISSSNDDDEDAKEEKEKDETRDVISAHVSSIGAPYVASVSDSPPLTRTQYEAARLHWPCTFHEDKRVTSLIEGTYFSEREARTIRDHVARTLRVSEEARKKYGSEVDCDACIIVNPKDDSVISVAHDLSQFHGRRGFDDADFGTRDGPSCEENLISTSASSLLTSSSSSSSSTETFTIRPYYHAPMVAIDLVAASQGGGAYAIPLNRFPLMSFHAADTPSSVPSGAVDEAFRADSGSGAEGVQTGVTYLCTGYDVYLSKEPCLMCAMSLIHSRIRRLFYRHKAPDGALGTKFSIHTLESLNHHFEAFRLE